MFDIIKFRTEIPASSFNFQKFFFFDKTKIIECENVIEAEKMKNRKILILLRDYAFDDGAIKLIAQKKNICFVIELGRIIRTRGVPRAILLSKIRLFLKYCVKHGAYYTFATMAANESELRSAGELENIALLFDVNRGQINFAMKMIEHYF